MDQDTKLVGAIGEIRIDTLAITIMPISQAEELALDRQLRRAAETAAGDHYTRCKPMLEAMLPGDRQEAIREIVRLTGSKSGLSAIAMHDFRCSPEGVALELYARGKKGTPGLTLDGLQAIITPVNADELAAELLELLQGGDDKKS